MDEYGRTPLHYVCIDNPKDKCRDIAERLLSSGLDVNVQDNDAWTPLHFAAQERSAEVAKLLIENGADIDAKEINGNTPLWVAVMNSSQDTQVVGILVDAGANPDIKNNHGISPREIESELFDNET